MNTPNAFLLAFFFVCTGFAQSHDGTSDIGGGFTLTTAARKGHPFALDGFAKGYTIDFEGTKSSEMDIAYDLINNQLLMRDSTNNIYKIDQTSIAGFVTMENGQPTLFKHLGLQDFVKKQKQPKFYALHDISSNTLIIEHLKSFKDPNSSGWQSSRYHNKSGEYKTSEKYYALTKDSKYVSVKISLKSILKIFKDQAPALEKYVSKNSISVDNIEKLADIINYYHQLQHLISTHK